MKGLTQEQLNWIYEQEWFPKYCTNIIKAENGDKWAKFKSGEMDPEHLIFTAFTWIRTPEGDAYWIEIDQKWRKYYTKGDIKELTLQEIADKFNIPVSQLRIKE